MVAHQDGTNRRPTLMDHVSSTLASQPWKVAAVAGLGGALTITLLRKIGEGFEVHEMNEAIVFECIQELQVRHNDRALKGAAAKVTPALLR